MQAPVEICDLDPSLIRPFLSTFVMDTIETFNKIYAHYDELGQLCLDYSLEWCFQTLPKEAYIPLEEYKMADIVANNPLPIRNRPFLFDNQATALPPELEKRNHGIMDDVVDAMRHTVHRELRDQTCYFHPPSTADIQKWMSEQYPDRYPAEVGAASGWKNSVNQCLTHGQGWNFVTYQPTDGSKIKRHLLFERAFNGAQIIGSGQCKSLNDKKPKANRRVNKPLQTSESRAARPRAHSTASVSTAPSEVVSVPPSSTSTTTSLQEDFATEFTQRLQEQAELINSANYINYPSVDTTSWSWTSLDMLEMSDMLETPDMFNGDNASHVL